MSENTSQMRNVSENQAPLVPGEYRVTTPSSASVDAEKEVGGSKQANPDSASLDREAQSGLFPAAIRQTFGDRWSKVQAGFVDEPRNAVVEADRLVDEMLKRVQDIFAQRRAKLEKQWDAGTEGSTEDLRLTLQNYRSFFERLLKL